MMSKLIFNNDKNLQIMILVTKRWLNFEYGENKNKINLLIRINKFCFVNHNIII